MVWVRGENGTLVIDATDGGYPEVVNGKARMEAVPLKKVPAMAKNHVRNHLDCIVSVM